LNKLFGNNISLTENITAQWFNGNINSNFVNVSGNININDNYILDVSAIKFSDGTFFNNNIFNENIDSINSNISTLQTEMNAVEGNITLLQGNVSTLHNEMNAVEGNITLLQGNVSTLHNEMNAIEGNITLLQGNVSTLHNNTHQNVWSTHVSDDRLKHNEEPLDDALSLVRQLDVQTYDQTKIVLDADYNGDLSGIEHSRRHGVIAQELELVAPHLVHTITYHGYDISGVPNDLKGVDYFSLVGHCLRAIQQLDEKNLQQEETITNQTNEINPLKEKNLKLENKVDNLHIMMRNDKGNTGQHRCIANKFLEGNLYFGLIVCAKKNRYINFNNKLNITINENLPEVSLSEKENDISVFGVISTGEDIHNSREYSIETYTSIFYKTTSNENRLIINSLGEGGIWVSNKNGTLLSGHYITSSSIKGYGQKQNEGNLSNYTVAKITCDCEFTLVKKEKKKIKMKDVIVNEYNLKEYIYDNNGNLQYDNDLDENGNIQYDYEYDTRFLDENANILSGEEEYLSRLNNGENVYIACFVGCTYHCG
jgi:predicted  nucleic acid-binding Zn-ribbon protein